MLGTIIVATMPAAGRRATWLYSGFIRPSTTGPSAYYRSVKDFDLQPGEHAVACGRQAAGRVVDRQHTQPPLHHSDRLRARSQRAVAHSAGAEPADPGARRRTGSGAHILRPARLHVRIHGGPCLPHTVSVSASSLPRTGSADTDSRSIAGASKSGGDCIECRKTGRDAAVGTYDCRPEHLRRAAGSGKEPW